MHHYPNAQKEFKPPLIANENAYLGDVFSRSGAPLFPLSATLTTPQRQDQPRQAHVGRLLQARKRHAAGIYLHLRRDEDHCRGILHDFRRDRQEGQRETR